MVDGEWVPPERRRPADEFYDMSTIDPVKIENVEEDGSIQIITEVEGSGNFPEITDTVYYKHETRFDNGQLVDLNETRKVADLLQMNDTFSPIFFRKSFQRMLKNQVAFIKVAQSQHKGIYHQQNLNKQKTVAEKEHMQKTVGPDIYIRVTITNIKRDPKCDTGTPLDEKLVFYEKIRGICRDLVAEGEYSNAKKLYARCISIFKNMPKKQKESLDDEQKKQRDEILNVLNSNSALCMLKKKMYKDCIKFAKDAISYQKHNPKAYFRMALAYKEESDFDRA